MEKFSAKFIPIFFPKELSSIDYYDHARLALELVCNNFDEIFAHRGMIFDKFSNSDRLSRRSSISSLQSENFLAGCLNATFVDIEEEKPVKTPISLAQPSSKTLMEFENTNSTTAVFSKRAVMPIPKSPTLKPRDSSFTVLDCIEESSEIESEDENLDSIDAISLQQ
jgi:hypothetical protein